MTWKTIFGTTSPQNRAHVLRTDSTEVIEQQVEGLKDVFMSWKGTVTWMNYIEDYHSENAIYVLQPDQTSPLHQTYDLPSGLVIGRDGTTAWKQFFGDNSYQNRIYVVFAGTTSVIEIKLNDYAQEPGPGTGGGTCMISTSETFSLFGFALLLVLLGLHGLVRRPRGI